MMSPIHADKSPASGEPDVLFNVLYHNTYPQPRNTQWKIEESEEFLGILGGQGGLSGGQEMAKEVDVRRQHIVRRDARLDWQINKCRLSLRESRATFAERKATVRPLLIHRSLPLPKDERPTVSLL
jgi:hypothetical protein